MKKYILIQNDGEIESNSFELIGASTKRDEKGKIGFFGSGLKYSIAYMMRNNIEFKIFSGKNEMKFSTKPEVLKDKTFERICINGIPTSYTTTMGPTWTQDWFVLREIYCNALDESSCLLVPETDIVQPSAGKTRIYIELTPSLKKVSANWDSYFSIERTPDFSSNEVYTCFVGQSDGATRQKVSIFNKTDGVLFRRGIRVHEDKEFLYDYGLEYVDINEDRTAKHGSSLGYMIRNLMARLDSEAYVKTVLRCAVDDRKAYEYTALTGEVHDRFSEKWIEFSKSNLLVNREKSGKYTQQINETAKEVFFLPAYFARQIKKQLPDCVILGMGNVVGDFSYHDVEESPKMSYLIKEVLSSLSQINYSVPYKIRVVEFDKQHIMGHADMKDKVILIASSTFDKGRREIALTIMEENEHLRSGAQDESRAFESHLISEWLKSMEESNALFL